MESRKDKWTRFGLRIWIKYLPTIDLVAKCWFPRTTQLILPCTMYCLLRFILDGSGEKCLVQLITKASWFLGPGKNTEKPKYFFYMFYLGKKFYHKPTIQGKELKSIVIVRNTTWWTYSTILNGTLGLEWTILLQIWTTNWGQSKNVHAV